MSEMDVEMDTDMDTDITIEIDQTNNCINNELIFHRLVKPYITERFSKFLRKVLKEDNTFISYNHELKWAEYVDIVMDYLNCIIREMYCADINYRHFFHDTSYCVDDNTRKSDSIADLVNKIKFILVNKFKTSPPFTILSFLQCLIFENSYRDYLIPMKNASGKEDNEISYKGLVKYTKKLNNLINDERCEITVDNVYNIEENNIPIQYKRNNVLASIYLLSLLKIISVESTVDDVDNDISNYDSKNGINSIESIQNDTDNGEILNVQEDTVLNCIKMVKIPWYKPSMLSSSNEIDEAKGDNN